MKTETVALSAVHLSDINPRTIREPRFLQLVNSLLEFPEMLSLRPAVIASDGLCLGGNMRTRAKQHLVALSNMEKDELLSKWMERRANAQGAGYDADTHAALLTELLYSEQVEVTRAPATLTEAQKKEFIIKDNAGFGEWDTDKLANGDWPDTNVMNSWGMELPTVWSGSEVDLDNFFAPSDAPNAKKSSLGHILLEYTDEDFARVQAAFGEHQGSREQVVFELLGLE